MFDKVINGTSDPGIKFLKGISSAFGMSLPEVILKLDEFALLPNDEQWRNAMMFKLSQVTDEEDRALVGEIIVTFIRRAEGRKSKPRGK